MTARGVAKAREFSIDTFINLFIMALVLRGKHEIHIRRECAHEERCRMHNLFEFLGKRVDETDRKDKDWLYFIVRLRNELSPGNIGSFDHFYHQFRRKQSWLTSIDWPDCNYFKLDVQAVTAKSYLDQADSELRQFAEKCADVYVTAVTEG